MKVLLTLAALIAFSCAFTQLEYQNNFVGWMQQHQKSYRHDEFQVRFQIFKANADFIENHNQANKSFTVAMNKFGDLTAEEFSTLYHGTRYTFEGEFPTPSAINVDLPVEFNWNTKGAVTPIKNQQQCGSCWAFSTTGSTEGCHFLTTNKLVSVSEQNLVDCSTSQGNQGCDGGLMTQAMNYIISNNGIDTEASYPYTATDGTCVFNAKNVGATLKSYINVIQGDENDLQLKTSKGPVSVAIDASHSSFQFYSSGVYTEPACSTSALDHGVLSIGWGHDQPSHMDYWIVKNSWGTDWGMSGFIWMQRNHNNMCGIATMATLPQC